MPLAFLVLPDLLVDAFARLGLLVFSISLTAYLGIVEPVCVRLWAVGSYF